MPQCRLNNGFDLSETMLTGEIVFVSLFTIEFLLHLVSARSFQKFWRSSSNIIDALAIAPFYLEVAYSLATIGSIQFDVGGEEVSFELGEGELCHVRGCAVSRLRSRFVLRGCRRR